MLVVLDVEKLDVRHAPLRKEGALAVEGAFAAEEADSMHGKPLSRDG